MTSLKVFSLNTMGIPLAPKRRQRFNLLCQFIKRLTPDIVALQEIGDVFIYKLLKNQLSNYNFYPQKVNGLINRDGALLLITKLPLKNYKFVKYKISSGPFLPFSLVEKLSRKGFQIGELVVNSQKIYIINTHLLASFFNNQKEYLYMQLQLKELISYIRFQFENQKLIITGDFNFSDHNPLYKLFVKEIKCHDPLYGTNVFTHEKDNLNIKSLNKFFQKLSWANKREDYTFVRGMVQKNISQSILDKKFYLKNKPYHLSDHYGVETTIKL